VGVCVAKKTFDTFVENKFVVANEVIQGVKLSGVPGLQLNDAEMVLESTAHKMLNIPAEDIAVRYRDHKHEERLHSNVNAAQKLYLPDGPSRFEIQVRCQQSNQQCNLVQMELLAALRDRKTEFNTALRKVSGKETAFVAASGLPAITSLSGLGSLREEDAKGMLTASNAFLACFSVAAGIVLGMVAFFKLRKHQSFAREPMAADTEPLSGSVPDVE